MAGSDDRLWTVRNSSDDRDRRVPCIQGIIHIPGLQTFLPGILRICRLGTGGQYGRRRQHRCADLHRWVALHLRPGASHRDSVFPGISDLHHGDLPEVWREILPPGSRDLRRDPVCCLWLGGTHGACTGDQDLV